MSKIKFCRQLTQTECGICCVSMLSSFYGLIKPLSYYRSELNVGRDGSSLKDLCDIFKANGFNTMIMKIEVNQLNDITLPIIAYEKRGHFVVIDKIKNDLVYLYDPAKGRERISIKKYNKIFGNIVLQVKPNDSFEKVTIKEKIWSNYLGTLKENRKRLSIVFILSIISYALTIFLPLFVRNLIDYNNTDFSNNNYVITIIVLFTCFLTISILRNINITKLTAALDNTLVGKVIRHLFKLPYNYFESRGSSEIIYRLSLIPSIRNLLANGIIQGIIDFGTILILLIYTFFIDIYVFLFSTIAIISIFVYVRVMNSKILDRNQDEIQANSALNAIQIESLMESFTIKSMGLEETMLEKYMDYYKNSLEKFVYREKLSKVNSSILGSLQTFLPIFILVICLSIPNLDVSYGTQMALYSLSGMLFTTAISFFQNYSNISLMKNMVIRLNDILDESADNQYGEQEVHGFNNLEFKDVCFKYSKNSNYVVKNINFKINKGETVAFVGSTGSGKSTISKLISFLYNHSDGDILINGISSNNLKVSKIKKLIGLVPQNPSLFNKTILENICLEGDYTTEEIKESMKIAEVYNDVMAMPMKFNTLITDFGMNLSGGQKQRIALARALIKNPEILILDEATSSLDSITEKNIMHNLEKLNYTKIIIAHRLSTIRNADKIIVMDNGEIMEVGSHQQLMTKKGYYYNLYQKQLQGSEDNE